MRAETKRGTIIFVAIALGIFCYSPKDVSAHPGNTDSLGCHTCRTNCPSWGLSYGEYHCHAPKAAPQPIEPIKSTYRDNGTGYITPAPVIVKIAKQKCLIKGNVTKKGKTKTKIYHVPNSRYYKSTKIKKSEGDKWFCTEKEAKKAGFRKSK